MNARPGLWQILKRDRIALTALGIVLTVVLTAVVGPWLSPYAFDQTSAAQFSSPSWSHWCGTDLFGRDLLTRMLYGARLSLLVAAVGAGVSLVIGVVYGAVSGYAGGRVDNAMMRGVEVLASLPRLIFVIVLIAVLQKHTETFLTGLGLPGWVPQARLLLLFVGLGCVEWLTMARIVRGQVLVLRESQFVQAARALGQSHSRILVLHVLPNITSIVLVYLTLTLPVVMLEESFLSFLGLGVQPPAASWGSLLSSGAQLLNPLKIAWWLLVFPGGLMALTLIALNVLGDALRDALDPRSRK
jgi:peptide/nickel transport system permease protein/oligopeptide transport system permease protein